MVVNFGGMPCFVWWLECLILNWQCGCHLGVFALKNLNKTGTFHFFSVDLFFDVHPWKKGTKPKQSFFTRSRTSFFSHHLIEKEINVDLLVALKSVYSSTTDTSDDLNIIGHSITARITKPPTFGGLNSSRYLQVMAIWRCWDVHVFLFCF